MAGFSNPITGGQGALDIPQIKSPNYVAGVSGWIISRDGSAEFNNLTIRGVFRGTNFLINSNGAFFYSGVPALGNLIASITSVAGVDPFGNFVRAGITSAENVFGTSATLFGSSLEFDTATANPTRLLINTQGAFLYDATGGAGHLIAAFAVAAGNDSFGNAYPQGLYSQQLTLLNQASAPPIFAGGSVFYSSVVGRPRFRSAANTDNVLQRADVNTATFPIGNTAVRTQISSPFNYQNNEGALSSEFELEIDGVINTGSVTAQTLTFDLSVDGVALGAVFTIGAVYLANNLSFEYSIRFRLTITATGVGGTANTVSDGTVNRSGVNLGSAANTTLSVGAVGTAKPFDTTALHTVAVFAQWGGTNAGQNLTTVRTRVTKRF